MSKHMESMESVLYALRHVDPPYAPPAEGSSLVRVVAVFWVEPRENNPCNQVREDLNARADRFEDYGVDGWTVIGSDT